ncbi:MAG: hypothetical protein LUH47_11010 [Clostridiales bacterium]|nr:hypothetical protein [Clostridiales bacterium]
MENYYKNSIKEIKRDLNKLEEKSSVKILFVTIAAISLLTLLIVYIILKCKNSACDDLYDEFSEDDGADFPFDEDDEELSEEEEEEEA